MAACENASTVGNLANLTSGRRVQSEDESCRANSSALRYLTDKSGDDPLRFVPEFEEGWRLGNLVLLLAGNFSHRTSSNF